MPDTELRLRRIDVLLLVALALAAFLPGQFGLPPIDRDESRYAVATSQMLASADFIDIRFQDQPRHLQPAGIYWLQAIAVSALSSPEAREIWAYRVPSVLGAVISILLTASLAARLFGRRAGLISGVLMASCLLLGVEARMAKIDAMMLAVVLAAQYALALLYLGRTETPARLAVLFWAAIGLGLMLKGPVPTIVSASTVVGLVAWDRKATWLSRLHAEWGVPLALAIVMPWLLAIIIRTHGAFLEDAIGHSLLGKVATGQQAHGAPPGYHLLAFNLAFWPASLFAVLAMPHIWQNRQEPAYRFLIVWIVPTWIVFELVATKLPHYTLPTYPAIAILAAAALVSGAARLGEGRWRRARIAYLGLWMLLGVGLAVAPTAFAIYVDRTIDAVAVPVSVFTVAAAAYAALLVLRNEMVRAVGVAAVAAVVLWAGAFGGVLPRLDGLWISPRIITAVKAASRCEKPLLATTPYHEPSLVFLHGPDRTRLARTPEEAAEILAANRDCSVAVIGQHERERFARRASELGLFMEPAFRIEGRNYSNGRWLALDVIRPMNASASAPTGSGVRDRREVSCGGAEQPRPCERRQRKTIL